MANIQQSSHLNWNVQRPYTEQDVLRLHELLLEPGVHIITTNDMDYARSVILALLTSLKYYKAVSRLSASKDTVPNVSDIFQELDQYYSYSTEALLEYLNEFEHDFLWVEEGQQLQDALWYHAFIRLIHDSHIDKFLPVIILRQR